MSWRDRLDPDLTGSFRGVAFAVERADTTGGRRWIVHEYPRRDRPFTEDMGRRAREWRLTLFVAGDDYDRQRDALIEALEAPGAATLVHPFLGTFSAVATDPRWRESTRELGMCIFQVTFVESGEQALPATSYDTPLRVMSAAQTFEQSLLADFTETFSVKGLLGWSLIAVERDLSVIVGGLDDVVGGIAGEIVAAIQSPADIANIVLGGYNRLRGAVMRPAEALSLYQRGSTESANGDLGGTRLATGTPVRGARLLRELGTDDGSVVAPIADSPERRQRATNTVAAKQLNGRAAAVAAARLLAETDWVSRDDALLASQDTLALIDSQLNTAEPIDDDVYAALVELRLRVSEDLRARVTALPGLTTYTPGATLPALVIAHTLYGDATRADEIAARNHVEHPGALRGGMTLEVLSE